MEGVDQSISDSNLSRLSQDTSRQLRSSLENGDSDSVKLFLGDGDMNIFSSSLPTLFHKKLNLSVSDAQFVDRGVSLLNGEVAVEQLRCPEDMETQIIGNLLPDDEELFAGISDGFDFLNSSNNLEEPEDFDLFSSGGGLEMDGDNTKEALGLHLNTHGDLEHFTGGSATHPGSLNGAGSVVGEHPYGEHPSRTLFVRNINSNVEDSELRALFEQYGAIRTLYTACKHRGFVMISYYDIRAARSAMRSLQNKPLRRRKLDIHFSIPKDNPSDKDINQGTLVVFNLDSSVSNDDLRHIFGAYGEVKEIRETPHKRHHKFIEFYDVRAAEAALRALNRSDIAGKRIKLEPSRPGGARRSLMQQLSQEHEQEETRLFRQQASSPHTNSPSGHPPFWGHVGSPIHNGFIQGFHHSVGLGTSVPSVKKPLVGIPANLPYTNPSRIGTIGDHLEHSNYIEANHSHTSVGLKAMQVQHPHSFPEYGNGFMPFYTSAVPASVHSASTVHATQKGIEGLHLSRRTTDGAGNNLSLFEQPPGAIGMTSNGSIMHQSSVSGRSGSLSGPQFLWGNPNHYQQSIQNSSAVIWSTPAFNHTGHSYGYSGTCSHSINTEFCSHQHHTGSVPIDPSFAERHLGYPGESSDTPLHDVGLLVPAAVSGNSGPAMNMRGGHGTLNPGAPFKINGELEGKASADIGIISPQCNTCTFQTGGHPIPVSGASQMLAECGRIHKIESSSIQIDNKKQYRLDIARILCGEDIRTTLMIKNIPNKYTSKMLLAAIDENHHGTYDFLYLPIDFKNKCNVGYAFINMMAPQHIIPFYEAFNGKRWEKFNSEKVATLAYARIQGKAALVAHFQNSSLMNEDKRCRPILLYSDGHASEDQEPFPLGVNIHSKGKRDKNGNGDPFDCSRCGVNKDGSGRGSAGSSSSEKHSNSLEENEN